MAENVSEVHYLEIQWGSCMLQVSWQGSRWLQLERKWSVSMTDRLSSVNSVWWWDTGSFASGRVSLSDQVHWSSYCSDTGLWRELFNFHSRAEEENTALSYQPVETVLQLRGWATDVKCVWFRLLLSQTRWRHLPLSQWQWWRGRSLLIQCCVVGWITLKLLQTLIICLVTCRSHNVLSWLSWLTVSPVCLVTSSHVLSLQNTILT